MTYAVTVAEAEAHRMAECRRDCPVCRLEDETEDDQ